MVRSEGVDVTSIEAPGIVADGIDLDLERYGRMASARPLPPIVAETADLLRQVSARLREAEARSELVELDWGVTHLIDAFRTALRLEAGDRREPGTR
jgi:hypothetical protein